MSAEVDARAGREPGGMPPRVLIAGGGFAAIEAMLALRAAAGDDVAIELIAPEPSLAFHPAATAEGFADGPPLSVPLAPIVADAAAFHRQDRLEAVAPAARSVRLASGARLRYDALVLALGAQRRARVAGGPAVGGHAGGAPA